MNMQVRETSPGDTGSRVPSRRQLRCDNLQNLPQELLQMVLKDVPRKFLLRSICKAFARSLASCCDAILLNRLGLVSQGPRREVSSALNAFPNARCVVINLEARLHDSTRADNVVLNVQGDVSSAYTTADQTFPPILSSQPTSAAAPSCKFLSTANPDPNQGEEEELILQTLSALRGHTITSLAIIHFSCPPPLPTALAHMRFTLLQLELSTTSYGAAVEQGAVNVYLRDPQALCARSDAMIQLAVSLPSLRRLSLSTAAFSVSGVVALTELSKLDSLSLVGCMDCPGGTAQAAETYRRLLLALPALRQLRLPMAVAVTVNSASAALLDNEDEDENEDYARDSGEGIGTAGCDGSGCSGIGTGGLLTGLRTRWGEDSGASDDPVWCGGSSTGSSSPHGTYMGPRCTTGHESMPGSGSSSTTLSRIACCCRCEPALAHSIGTASHSPVRAPSSPSRVKTAHSFQTKTAGGGSGSRYRAFFCTRAAAAAAAATACQQPQRRQQSFQADVKFTFPPRLQDLTIPLCSLNRPIFVAVCAAYGCDGHGDAEGDGCDCAVATLRSDGPMSASAFAGPHSTNVDGTAIGGTDSGGGGNSNSLRALHIATLGGYSHWEGSFLKSLHDFELLSRLRCLETLHLRIDPGTIRLYSSTMQAYFQNLLMLRNLKDLRVSEAQPPACFSIRNPLSFSHHPAVLGSLLATAAAAKDGGAPLTQSPPSLPRLLLPPSPRTCPLMPTPPPSPRHSLMPPPTRTSATVIARVSELPSAALQLLRRQWPHLSTLQFFSETIIRGSEGQLLVSESPSAVGLLPPPCACCTTPCLMAVVEPSIGRWGRAEYANLRCDLDETCKRENT